MHRPLTLPLALALLAAGCGGPPADEQAPPPATGSLASAGPTAAEEDAETPAQRLDRLFAEHWDAWLELNPVRATFLGDHRWDDRWPVDISPAHVQAERALLERSLAAAGAIPADELDADRRLSYELFLYELRDELAGYAFPRELTPVNQFRNPGNRFARLGSGKSAQPFDTVADYEAFLGRAEGFGEWVDQAIVNMRRGMDAGIVQPAILMERTLPQLEAHMVEEPADSLFYGPVAEFPDTVPEGERERLRTAYARAITETIAPAYARLHAFIREEYLPAARESAGLGALPGGEDWYAWLVRHHTTTDLTPDEIHRIGLDEVERIHGEMIAIKEEVGFEGDLQAFFEYLNTEPRFYFESREEMVAAYEALRASVEVANP